MPPSNTKAFDPVTTSIKGTGDRSEITACQEADTRLEALLLEGLRSGDPIPVDEHFWIELMGEAERRVEARKTGGSRG